MQVCAPFQVVDFCSGRVLFEVGATAEGPHMRFFDLQGNVVFELGCEPNSEHAHLDLYYTSGRDAVSLTRWEGSREASAVVGGDCEEGPTASLIADRDGSGASFSVSPTKFSDFRVEG